MIAAILAANTPFYALVLHNAIQTRVNRRLLEQVIDSTCKDREEE